MFHRWSSPEEAASFHGVGPVIQIPAEGFKRLEVNASQEQKPIEESLRVRFWLSSQGGAFGTGYPEL
jgi:hypothetical protein